MKIANNRLPITSFVLVDETGRVIDDLENLNEHTQLKLLPLTLKIDRLWEITNGLV